ncbi:hypothetical protein BSKO_08023 [Bryopsis sp. KO-2023]|nr:hypothetical protein BSKO_08023 [Bryopsis sp. KO-2023]
MRCRVRDKPGTQVAIKEFKLEDDDPDAEEVKKTMHREVKLLHDLQHRHVVKFIEHFKIAEKVFIVMEFVPMNLLEVLEEKAGGLNKDMVRRVIYEVVSAIAFIHSKGVVYRDIKPENMLITKEGEVKLCDFGFARYVDRTDDVLTDYVATRWYRAPELLLGPPFMKGGAKVQCPYGKAVDMWAIGCLMGELLDGEPLFAGDSDIDQLYRIQQILGSLMDSHTEIFEGNPSNQGIVFNVKKPTSLGARYHEKADADELDFMEGLLDMDPEKRRTSEECLHHQYLLPLAEKYSS